jgi:TolB-like protein
MVNIQVRNIYQLSIMTKHIALLLFIGLAWGQTTIAVFDFENNGLKKHEVRQLSTRLESEVVKIGGFRVVERTKIDEIMKEQKFQMSGCVDECLIEIGKMLGAKQIILGSVGELAGLYTITVKLVDAETGELIRTSNYDAENGLKELLKIGLEVIAYELVKNERKKTLGDKNFVKKTKNIKERIQKSNLGPYRKYYSAQITKAEFRKVVDGRSPSVLLELDIISQEEYNEAMALPMYSRSYPMNDLAYWRTFGTEITIRRKPEFLWISVGLAFVSWVFST